MKWLIIAWTLFCVVGCMSGMAKVGDMESMSSAEQAGTSIGVLLGWVMWFVIWSVVCIPAYIIGRMFGSSKRSSNNNVSLGVSAKPILCADCGKYFESAGEFCPNCGAKQVGNPAQTNSSGPASVSAPIVSARNPHGGIFQFLKVATISTVLGVGLVVVVVGIVESPRSASSPSSVQEPRAALSTSAVADPAPKFAKLSCKEFSKQFGIRSTLSDLQKNQAFEAIKGSRVKWTAEVVEVSETFGTPSVQVKCLPETLVSDAIVSFPSAAKADLLALRIGSQVTFEAAVNSWGSLTPHSLVDGKVLN